MPPAALLTFTSAPETTAPLLIADRSGDDSGVLRECARKVENRKDKLIARESVS